ncbi:hypothetical protein M9H77_09089 [Catharanthus roseus]|uniref:Uncharacterized protein n=1 Tax=Catharanthus roseus TaxID=4058 RepID=A0ACC0BZL2_CATRO|nr:hypothetical protein M9H77_09089 [Catharanthus roseus]
MAEKPWVIQVDNHVRETVLEMEKKCWDKRSIYKMPNSVTNINKKAYTPQLVSFGPYHYNNKNLNPMEEHKDRALLHVLKRSRKPLQSYFQSLIEVVEDLKEAYESLDSDLKRDSDAFLRIMIRDGIFMLEILRFFTENVEGFAGNDPIFSNHGRLYVMPIIGSDMLMLENQLPMLVLHKLLAVDKGLNKEDQELTNGLILKFFFPTEAHSKAPSNCLHALDMYRKALLQPKAKTQHLHHHHHPPQNDILPPPIPKGHDDVIPSATELTEAGIIIKRSKTASLKDITFSRGVLKLPPIILDDITKPLFLNLVAFERFHVGAGNEVSGFVFFMDNIIDNARDIALLSSRKIIQNSSGSNKAAAELFTSLAKDVMLDSESKLGVVCMDINNYCKKSWPKYRANLIQTYFRSPWELLSLVAAILLFGLTILQSVYTVLG